MASSSLAPTSEHVERPRNGGVAGGEPYLLLRLSKEGKDGVGVSSRKTCLAPFAIGIVGGVVVGVVGMDSS